MALSTEERDFLTKERSKVKRLKTLRWITLAGCLGTFIIFLVFGPIRLVQYLPLAFFVLTLAWWSAPVSNRVLEIAERELADKTS